MESSRSQATGNGVQATGRIARATTSDSTPHTQEATRSQPRQSTRFASCFASTPIHRSVGSLSDNTVSSLLSDTSPVLSSCAKAEKRPLNDFVDKALSSSSKSLLDHFSSVMKSAMDASYPYDEAQSFVNGPISSAPHGEHPATSAFNGFPTTLSVPTSAGTMTSGSNDSVFESFSGWDPLSFATSNNTSTSTYGYSTPHDASSQTTYLSNRTVPQSHTVHPGSDRYLSGIHSSLTGFSGSNESELSAAAARFEPLERAALNSQGNISSASRFPGYSTGVPTASSEDILPSPGFYNHHPLSTNTPLESVCPPFDAFNSLSLNDIEPDRNAASGRNPFGIHSSVASSLAPQRLPSNRLHDLYPFHGAVGTSAQSSWSGINPVQEVKRPLYVNNWGGVDHGHIQPHMHQNGLYVLPELSNSGFIGVSRYRGVNNGSIHAQQSSLATCIQPVSRLPSAEPLDDKLQKAPASALMLAFRRDPNALKTWTIKMIENHIAEFAGDQQGSRLIQNRLDGACSEDKMTVYSEMRPNVRQFMNDIYANYIVQKLFDLMDMPHKLDLASSISGHMRRLSMHTYGCRVVQKALEVLIDPQRAELIQELEGFVDKAISDQNGNHVIQKAVEFIDNSSIDFIINFFRGNIRHYSKHAYGCRVVQRMLEHCKPSNLTWILREIRDCAGELIRDTYGNYVVQHIIRRGPVEERKFFEGIIEQRMVEFSKHKYASNVVECAIKNTEIDNVMKFALPLKATSSTLLTGMRDPYTNYVIQTLLETLKGQHREDFASDLRALFPKLKEKKETESINQKQITALEAHLYNPSYVVAKDSDGSVRSSTEKIAKRTGPAVDTCSGRFDSTSVTTEHPERISTPRRNGHTRPSSSKVIGVSPSALSDALDRSVHECSVSSSAHTSNERSYATDTTATTPSMTEAVPDVQTPLSSTTNSLNDGTSGRQLDGWRESIYTPSN
ncbi:hypothetical protein KEM54_001430 [Ascosphaera aggregata]|nr:hypothetical protein KEM54_001430 [Ascosphaera aggregata]